MSTVGYAWRWQGDQDPTLLQRVEQVIATPQAGEVIVANKAIALNPVDWKVMTWSGYWPVGRVPGVDGVGEVISVGAGVAIAKGTLVAYHQGIDQDGSYASHVTVKADGLLPIPNELDYLLAATVPCPGLTAWQALQKIPTEPQRTVLVTGAGSSVGWFVTQLAIQRGFRVIVTASAKHHPKLYRLGVIAALDYREADWQTQLKQLTVNNPLYAIIDTVGAEQAEQLAPLVAYNGHLVCVMGRIEHLPTPAVAAAGSYHEVALASVYKEGHAEDWLALRKSGNYLLKALADGSLQVPDISVIDFAEIPAALARLKASPSTAKIIARLG